MKIRMEGNSVRLRLRRSEVEELAQGKAVRGTVAFPEGLWQYALEPAAGASRLGARLTKLGITVTLPEDWALAWADSPQVGFEHNLVLETGGPLYLLIEKDFVCLDRDPSGQQDQFPNPKAGNF
ncbi:hypothetical protein OZ410_11275 [Robiginitalea sp. M366]|uniref:DUF7009 family protein n=1 Tax=Robiginitalea aestuariiviva TaxID=3036903 RepID=UPI00240E1C54|nr:hypothetical protein [Robiginitalea aestuariiviva]MDG1572898.1 hypothetical protein [Robiginitalea aestuariiviva]